MLDLPFVAIDSVVDLVTIGLVLLVLYYVVRQRINRIFDAKVAILVVYAAFLAGMLLELLRDFTISAAFIDSYSIGQITLILLIVILLSSMAHVAYLHPPETRFGERLGALFQSRLWPHGIAILMMTAYVSLLEVYAVVVRPFTVVYIPVAGEMIATVRYGTGYLLFLTLVLVMFLLYAVPLFVLAASREQSRGPRRALMVLPVSWIIVGADLLTFNGLLPDLGINAIIVGHVLLACVFGATVVVFRNVNLLGSMFEPMKETIPEASSFSGMLGVGPSEIQGWSMLLEVDSSVSYEQAVKDFVTERLSNRSLVFVFTFAASPVLGALAGIPEARLYVATGSVSYARPTENPHRILIPQYDAAVLLDLMDRTVSSESGSGATIVFDNISDFILSNGFEDTIKMLKQMLEIVGSRGATSLFLINSTGHDETIMSFVRNLFQRVVSYGHSGLKAVK